MIKDSSWYIEKIKFDKKNKISKTDYLQLYCTGSSPGKFYRTVKIHKLPNGGHVAEFPLRPIVSNIGTASYYLSKY